MKICKQMLHNLITTLYDLFPKGGVFVNNKIMLQIYHIVLQQIITNIRHPLQFIIRVLFLQKLIEKAMKITMANSRFSINISHSLTIREQKESNRTT